MGMGYSTDDKHFFIIKGGVIAQSCDSTIWEPILNTEGKIILKSNSISVIALKILKSQDTNILYEVDCKF